MRLTLLSLLCLCCALTGVAGQDLRSQPLMNEIDAEAYNQYLLRQAQVEQAYSPFTAFQTDRGVLPVQCPVGTRGLSVPPAHVNFWKAHEMTKMLQWSGENRFMCVPVRLRASLTPIITKLKQSSLITVDPLTQPQLMREIGLIQPVETMQPIEPITQQPNIRPQPIGIVRPLPVQPQQPIGVVQPVQSIRPRDLETEQQIMEQMIAEEAIENEAQEQEAQAAAIEEADGDFSAQGIGRFGGFGFGRGFGRFGGFGLGFGFPLGGFGYGFGYPALGYSAVSYGYPVGLGYSLDYGYGGLGLGYGGLGLGYGGLGLGYGGLGLGYGGFGLGFGRFGRFGRGFGRFGGFGRRGFGRFGRW